MRLNKVLIIKIAAIGDLLMATPAIRALKKSNPFAELTLLAGASIREAAAGNPYIDRIIEIDDKALFSGGLFKRWRLAAGLIGRIRKERFDAAVILHRDWKYGAIAMASGISERAGFGNSYWSRLFLTRAARITGVSHHIDHYLEVVRLLGARADGRGMDFYISEAAREKASKTLLEHGCLSADLVGVAPGGARNVKEVMDTRRWPAGHYRELIGRLAASGFRVVLIGSEGDKWFLEGWEAPQGAVNLMGKTTLVEAAALMERCSVVAANDSGLMHLASAAGTPVVSIFGPTDPREKYPMSAGSFYFWKGGELECAPCYKDGVFPDCKTLECMRKISVDEIYAKIIETAGQRRRTAAES